MESRITIPAACLEVLGGLEEGDPPVLVGTEEYGPFRLCPWHPLFEGVPAIPEHAVIVLPQSSAALLRVLARHVGLSRLHDLDTPALIAQTEQWCLLTEEDTAAFPAGRTFRGRPTVVPTLHRVTDPTQALAEVVVWVARVERLRQSGHLLPPDGLHDLAPIDEADLAAQEQQAGLTAWGVTRG